jgi:hypothetical protein
MLVIRKKKVEKRVVEGGGGFYTYHPVLRK